MFCHQKIAFRNLVIVLLFQVVICTLQFIGYRRQSSRLSLYLDSTSLGVFNKYINKIEKKKEETRKNGRRKKERRKTEEERTEKWKDKVEEQEETK